MEDYCTIGSKYVAAYFPTVHYNLVVELMAEDLSCNWCSYCCKEQLDLIKHSFGAHSLESSFHFKCGIGGCLHQFHTRTTFYSFKSHADRKHPHWRERISNNSAEHQAQDQTEESPMDLEQHPV